MKKLVAKMMYVTEDQLDNPEKQLKLSEPYVYFQDPETNKWYNPVDGFVVTGDDLSDKFVEVNY